MALSISMVITDWCFNRQQHQNNKDFEVLSDTVNAQIFPYATNCCKWESTVKPGQSPSATRGGTSAAIVQDNCAKALALAPL
jgi:hypothetical protein